MRWKNFLNALLVGGMMWGCSNDPSGPGSGPTSPGGDLVQVVQPDPVGDPFGNRGPNWDITSMTLTRDAEAVTVVLEFSSNLIAPFTGDSNAMIGFVDFDTDQDTTTGDFSIVDAFRRDSGSTGMKKDYRVDFANLDADSMASVFNEEAIVQGKVKPVYQGKTVTLRIPRSMLGNDDGFLWASAIVGSIGSPTDFVPQQGHIELNDPNAGLVMRGRPVEATTASVTAPTEREAASAAPLAWR